MFSEKELDSILSSIFHLSKFEIEGDNIFISNKCYKEANMILSAMKKKETKQEKMNLIKKIGSANIKSDCVTQSLSSLLKIYNK
jgi:hypothetical protein